MRFASLAAAVLAALAVLIGAGPAAASSSAASDAAPGIPRPTEGGPLAYVGTVKTFADGLVDVHYVTSGLDAPPLNDDNNDGVPDYVKQVADAADRALGFYRTVGFSAIPPDRGGPDIGPDIYIKRLDPGVFGLTIPSSATNGGAFVVVSPRLDQSPDQALASLDGTVAHELFHLVQFGYVPSGNIPDWFAEGSATAMAGEVFPNVQDLVVFDQLGTWLAQPSRSLLDESLGCNYCYGTGLWWDYLYSGSSKVLADYLAELRAESVYGIADRRGLRALDLTLALDNLGGVSSAFNRFSRDIYRSGFDPATSSVKAQRSLQGRSAALQPLAARFLTVSVPTTARTLKLSLTASIGRQVGARVFLGGPHGREVGYTLHHRAETFSIRFRSAAERKHVMLVLSNGAAVPASYRLNYGVS